LRIKPLDVVCWCPAVTMLIDVLTIGSAAEHVPVPVAVPAPMKRFPNLDCDLGRLRVYIPADSTHTVPSASTPFVRPGQQEQVLLFEIASMSVKPSNDARNAGAEAEHDADTTSHGSFLSTDLPEDLNLLLSVDGIALYVTGWAGLTGAHSGLGEVSDQENPALRWNTSLHLTEDEVVQVPIIQPLSLSLLVTPLVSQDVAASVRRHTMDVYMRGGLNVFVSDAQIRFVQRILDTNFGALLASNEPSPDAIVSSPTHHVYPHHHLQSRGGSAFGSGLSGPAPFPHLMETPPPASSTIDLSLCLPHLVVVIYAACESSLSARPLLCASLQNPEVSIKPDAVVVTCASLSLRGTESSQEVSLELLQRPGSSLEVLDLPLLTTTVENEGAFAATCRIALAPAVSSSPAHTHHPLARGRDRDHSGGGESPPRSVLGSPLRRTAQQRTDDRPTPAASAATQAPPMISVQLDAVVRLDVELSFVTHALSFANALFPTVSGQEPHSDGSKTGLEVANAYGPSGHEGRLAVDSTAAEPTTLCITARQVTVIARAGIPSFAQTDFYGAKMDGTFGLLSTSISLNVAAANVLFANPSPTPVVLTTGLMLKVISNAIDERCVFQRTTVEIETDYTNILFAPTQLASLVGFVNAAMTSLSPPVLSAEAGLTTHSTQPASLAVHVDGPGELPGELPAASAQPLPQHPPSNGEQAQSIDDLRRGQFQYLVSLTRPATHQIVFSPDSSSEATMTWRYPYSRCISSILITPVPFDTERTDSSDDTAQLACVLSYWHAVKEDFVPLCHFSLYQGKTSQHRIPSPVAASEWRVCCVAAVCWILYSPALACVNVFNAKFNVFAFLSSFRSSFRSFFRFFRLFLFFLFFLPSVLSSFCFFLSLVLSFLSFSRSFVLSFFRSFFINTHLHTRSPFCRPRIKALDCLVARWPHASASTPSCTLPRHPRCSSLWLCALCRPLC
jgi:hypothetical protein